MMNTGIFKRTLILGIVFFCLSLPAFSQNLYINGSICAGSAGSILITVRSDSNCSVARVRNTTYWQFDPQPDGVVYNSATDGGRTLLQLSEVNL